MAQQRGSSRSRERAREKVAKAQAREASFRRLTDAAQRLPQSFGDLKTATERRPAILGAALMDFSRRRDQAARDHPALLPPLAWSTLALFPSIDLLRDRLGGSWDPLKATLSWSDQLFHATDDAVLAMWQMRAGHTVAAALIARSLLERWTLNVAHHHSIERTEGEDEEAFTSRVWSVYERQGAPTDAGAWWSWLSELLHGRVATTAFGEEYARPLDDGEASEALHYPICRVLELALRQVRGGVTTLAVEEGLARFGPVLQVPATEIPSIDEPPKVVVDGLHLLDYLECSTTRAQGLVEIGSIYRRRIEDAGDRLSEGFNPVFTVESLLERRGRAVARARNAFKEERKLVGDDEFDPGQLLARLFRYACIGELAYLLADEVAPAERTALLAAADALRGTTDLWLQDSDHAIACIRVLLEQTARLRAHRLRPARAVRQEGVRGGSASRWVELAGWKRLRPLVRATSEFAHLTFRTRRNGARELLRLMQLSEALLETSRGSALTEVAYMLAFELHARLLPISPVMAAAFTESVTLTDEQSHARRLERFLDLNLQYRGSDLGTPDFYASPTEATPDV